MMWNSQQALRLTHNRTGLAVTVGFERSWHRTLERARRILRARVHAHDKGLRAIMTADPVCVITEPTKGQFVAIARIGQYKYQISTREE